MAKITILLFDSIIPIHFSTHLEAIITDEATARSFHINFSASQAFSNSESIKESMELAARNKRCCVGSVTLYSNLDYDQFLLNYYHDFGNGDYYNYATNNCSDAVNYALDFFFPEKTKTEVFYFFYKTLCCWFCLGSCGVACFPVPPGINSPNDVFKKARLLSAVYGAVPEKKENVTSACVCESENWNANKLTKADSCKNGLSFAIFNNHPDVVLHFIQNHLSLFNEKHIAYAYLSLIAMKQNDLAKLLIATKPISLGVIEVGFRIQESKEEEKSHLVEHQYSFVSELLKHNYSRDELIPLLCGAIKNNIDFEFIRRVFEYHLGDFLDPPSGIMYKFISKFSGQESLVIDTALKRDRQDVLNYLLDNYFDKFTSYQLGRVFLLAVYTKNYLRAKSYIIKRPDIKKTWRVTDTGQYAQHCLASDPAADLKLFKLLCESEPSPDLKQKTKSGETTLSLAIKNKNVSVVRYLVNHHAYVLAEELPNALKYLEKVKQKLAALLRGKIARKRYRLKPDRNLSLQQVFVLGNDPEINNLEQYAASNKSRPIIIGTSGLRSLLLACQLSNQDERKIIPGLILIDKSKLVIQFWKDLRRFVLKEKSVNSFTANFPEFIQQRCHIFASDNIESYKFRIFEFCEKLFLTYGYDYVRSIILSATILAQSWGDKETFTKIKNIVNYLQTDNVYTYPSNIVIVEKAKVSTAVLKNIHTIKPKLAIHTDFDMIEMAPKKIHFFTDSDPDKISGLFCPSRELPRDAFKTVDIQGETFGVYDAKEIPIIEAGKRYFANDNSGFIQEKLLQFNIIFRIPKPQLQEEKEVSSNAMRVSLS